MVSRKFRDVYGAIRFLPTVFNRHFSTEKSVIPVFRKAAEHRNRIALRDDFGKYTYRDLLSASLRLSKQIQEQLEGKTQERVGLLCPNNASYVIAQWACWISGQIVVPLSASHPESILHYLMTDSQSSLLISIPQHEDLIKEICSKTRSRALIMDPALRENAMLKDTSDFKTDSPASQTFDGKKIGQSGNFYSNKDAMIIYTSGSTGLPKGVVLSHLNLESQVKSMIDVWNWEEKDCMLHALPLNHIHGIVNGLITPFYVGAKCVMLKDFDVNRIWAELIGVKIPLLDRVNVFTAVPTMYAKLIQEYDTKLNKSDRIADHIRQTCAQKIRLMMSGSAPLNRNTFERWFEITGHQLVERYGMTETGMILTAPIQKRKKPGNVGTPMPGVKVRLISDERDGSKKVALIGSRKGIEVIGRPSVVGGSQMRSIGDDKNDDTVVGVLHVSGDTVATRYWNKPQANASAFRTGWFNTGDIVEYGCDGNFTILGRVSSDIIKTGGYKVSAIQVETVLSEHESIADVAVVPLDDPVWGEKIGILVVLKEGRNLELNKLKAWAAKRLPEYALPRVIIESPDGIIPRNHMGKINRHQLREAFFLQPPQQSPQQTASASA